MLKRHFIAALALIAAATPALSADLIRKAPLASEIGYPVGCGLFYGISTEGSATPIKDAPVQTTALSGAVSGLLGYTCPIKGGTAFWFAEASVGAQALNGGGNGLGMNAPLHFKERVGIGGPISGMLGMLQIPVLSDLPSLPSIPNLPAGVTAGQSRAYVYAALNQDDISASFGAAGGRNWVITPEAGIGMLTRLSNQVVVDVWAGAKFSGNSVCLGGGAPFGVGNAGCAHPGTGFTTGIALKY